jgi:predicted metal-dependent TIM-barrel fold hydrolase
MQFFDPHIHVASRTTDDLAAMGLAGCVAVSEPAFWAGFDRSGIDSFRDYFRQISQWEAKRTGNYGIRHYCWIGMNAKEAENLKLSREVLALMPEFLDLPGVLGVGEIGLNKCTKNETIVLSELVDLAAARDEQILVHTPHLEDKHRGTKMILDILAADRRIDRSRVCIDHCEEHTLRLALDAGYWAGITLYPTTKGTPERAIDMVEKYGAERLMVNSSADWGPSDPMAVPKFMAMMLQRGLKEAVVKQIVYDNPMTFFNQSRNFKF